MMLKHRFLLLRHQNCTCVMYQQISFGAKQDEHIE